MSLSSCVQRESMSLRWTRLHVADMSRAPPARWGHSMTSIGDDRSIMLGGMSQDHSVSDDGFCYVHSSRSWMRLVWQPGQAPSDLWHHSTSLVHHSTLVVVGGKALKHATSVRLFDLGTGVWSHVPVPGDVFSPRTLHAAVTVGGSVLVHGGNVSGGSISSGSCSDELFCFDAATRIMKRLQPQGKKPSGRCRHSLNLVVSSDGDAHVVCYGGANDGQTLCDLWILNCSKMTWTQVNVLGECPRLEGHTAVTIKNRLTLFLGGYSRSKSDPSLLEWPGTGLFVFDLSSNTMSSCIMHGDFPRNRIGHTSSLCGHCLVVFGGMMPDGNGDSGGTYISSDITVECDKMTASKSSTTRSTMLTLTDFVRSTSPMSADDDESMSQSDSSSSDQMSGISSVTPGHLLSQAVSMNDLLHIEQQLHNTLQAISSLREDGLLSSIERKCNEFATSLKRCQTSEENVTTWVEGVVSLSCQRAPDVRIHIVMTLIKHTSKCGLMDMVLKELCSSYSHARVSATASMMCNIWTAMATPEALGRLRKMLMQEQGCYAFCLQALFLVRSLCSILPESYHLRQGILGCEHILTTAICSLNTQPSAFSNQYDNPFKIGYVSDIQRSCFEVVRLLSHCSRQIVLSTPANPSPDVVAKILGSCGYKGFESSLSFDIAVHLSQPDLWSCNVNIVKVLSLPMRSGPGIVLKFFPVPAMEVAGSLSLLLGFFNQDRPEIPACFRPIVHAFAVLYIGANIVQPYADNDCILKLLACKVLMNSGLTSDYANHNSLRELSAESFVHSLR